MRKNPKKTTRSTVLSVNGIHLCSDKEAFELLELSGVTVGQIVSSLACTELDSITSGDAENEDVSSLIAHWANNAHLIKCNKEKDKAKDAYNRYRWRWLAEHGISFDTFVSNVLAVVCDTDTDIEEYNWHKFAADPEAMGELYEMNTNGYSGMFYSCFPEFVDCDYE